MRILFFGLGQTAKNLILELQNKKKTHISLVSRSNHINIKNFYELKDIPFDKIKSAIERLPEGCRQIFTLYLMEGYKHQEIAEVLGISVSTSKSQYRYALQLLKEKLSKFRS